jgi:hypothetical protein
VAAVTDPNGVEWSACRRWWVVDAPSSGGEDLVLVILVVVFLFPLCFIAHGLGLPWTILIYRDQEVVGKEKVRGWGTSGRRIQEIADSAAAGTLRQSLGLPPGTGRDQPKHQADDSAAPRDVIRCLVRSTVTDTTKGIAIDVGKDALSVIALDNNALVASASLAQVTATPAKHVSGTPVLVVGVPGLRPMTIRPHHTQRFHWHGEVAKAKGFLPYLAADEEWLMLVDRFGLAPYISTSQ